MRPIDRSQAGEDAGSGPLADPETGDSGPPGIVAPALRPEPMQIRWQAGRGPDGRERLTRRTLASAASMKTPSRIERRQIFRWRTSAVRRSPAARLSAVYRSFSLCVQCLVRTDGGE